MSPRLSRAEQNDRNRALLLAAARRVFLTRGYYAATLEQIADEAGFSKGVVYSRFASKADMFLALLEDRIAERAAQNADLAGRLAGTGDFAAVLGLALRAERAAPGWRLLVTEFRIHAARDPELNRRYAALHTRTVDGLAAILAAVSAGRRPRPPVPAPAAGRVLARPRDRHRAGAAGQPGRPGRPGPAGPARPLGDWLAALPLPVPEER